MSRLTVVLGLCFLTGLASADLYLHNPPGSNDGALIRSFKSPALKDDEVKTGKLAVSHRKWSPITFEVLGGQYATKANELDFLEDAFKNHKVIELNFSMVNTASGSGRKLVYRSQFQGVKIQSLKKSKQGADPKMTISFTFQKINISGPAGASTSDDWN